MIAHPRLEGSAVLVTGAAGFIGSYVCQILLERGCEVHAVSRVSRESRHPRMRWWPLDLRHHRKTERVVRGIDPDYAIHLASRVSGSRDFAFVMPMFRANLESTVNVLHALGTANCKRIVLAGSMEEPGVGTELRAPGSPYAVAKAAAALYGGFFHNLYKMPVAHARIFMVYGPKQTDLKKLVPYVITAFLRGKAPQLGSGTRPVDWVFVKDVANALIRMLSVPSVDGRSLDVGTGNSVTIRELVGMLQEITGATVNPMFGTLADRPMENVNPANVSDTSEVLGWHPETHLAEGLRQTVDWYRANVVRQLTR